MTAIKNKKEPVRIRQKALSNGNQSLYLDIYVNGRRRYEFLKMYLIPEKNKEDREKNRETLRLADAVKSLRVVDIQSGRYGFNAQFKTETKLYDYYEVCTKRRDKPDTHNNYKNWISARRYLELFFDELTTFAEIDEKKCKAYREFITKEAKTEKGEYLSINSQHNYFCKFKVCIREAYRDRIIPEDVCQFVTPPKGENPERSYLSQDEVRRLSATECSRPVMKQAFLFSCLTGLRWSDIKKMTWSEVQEFDGGTRIVFKQKKTKQQEYLDIASQAANLLGERRGDDEKVFQDLKYTTHELKLLSEWAKSAGITKHVSFHTGRHTFAVLMLNIGTDIYTVQKLLGHRDIKTTQIYARLLDKTKQAAVAKIPDLL